MTSRRTAKPTVDELLTQRRHPLESEVRAVRDIIKGVDSRIAEEWKWNAPTFSFDGYLVTFNLDPTDRVHLVFHNGAILDPQDGFLEGNYPDRRMAYFTDMDDVAAKRRKLEAAIREWIRLHGG